MLVCRASSLFHWPCCYNSVQTVVRRLKHWQAKDPSLNPFIERTREGVSLGHSMATTTASNASPKPNPFPEDVVISAPLPTYDEQLSSTYLSAMSKVLALAESDLDALRVLQPGSTSRFVEGTLCAVRPRCTREGALQLIKAFQGINAPRRR